MTAWQRVQLGRVVSQVTSVPKGKPLPYISLEAVGSGTGRQLDGIRFEPRLPTETGMVEVRVDDVIYGKLRPYLAKSLLVAEDALASGEFIALRAGPRVEPRWLAHLVMSAAFRSWTVANSEGVKMPRTSWERVKGLWIGLPPLPEQRVIADFIDSEVARVDAILARRRRTADLVAERRRSLISRLVVGADLPGPRRKTALLGGLPADWPVMRLRHAVRDITVGVVVNPSSYFAEEGVPFLHGSDIRDGWIDRSSLKRLSEADNALLSKSRLCSGDVVVVRAGYPGRAAVITDDLDGANCASILILRRGGLLEPGYLCALMNSSWLRHQVAAAQYGAAQEQINVSDIVDFVVPVPPRAVQLDRLDRIQRASRHMDNLSTDLAHQVVLLQEHRQALITAAVTGQIDVTRAVA